MQAGQKVSTTYHNFVSEYNQFAREINLLMRALYDHDTAPDALLVAQLVHHHESIMIHAQQLVEKAERLGLVVIDEHRYELSASEAESVRRVALLERITLN
jgi:hypothetical protein